MTRVEALEVARRSIEREWEYAYNRREELEHEYLELENQGRESESRTANYYMRHWQNVMDELHVAIRYLDDMIGEQYNAADAA